eukprot:gnl/MRDRNA2_/MRDRNA2_122480_c0_seq1.p1 gnl/MRDRNA2_/MRDRNA2_122480_c0~~gnl/MRDRNA2_/MRDRNA2_122480_c0_seq1.p1  ORF type:complete len:139 (-),score=24.45 gnl/MRDRNA2_/MRDRNA2_122480_c0_seq1:75-491(-)
MHSVFMILLLVIAATSHAKNLLSVDKLSNKMADKSMDMFIDKLSDKLLSRVLNEQSHHSTDIDGTTLAKPASAGIPDRAGLGKAMANGGEHQNAFQRLNCPTHHQASKGAFKLPFLSDGLKLDARSLALLCLLVPDFK